MRAFLLAVGLSVSVAGHALEIPHPESDRPGSEHEAPVDKIGVKSFGHEFVEGSKAPDVWLDQAHLRSLHGPRLARWQDAPPEKRVFIIASAEDAPSVHALQKNLEEKGFATFF